jgi:hypothetical protein
VLDMRCFPQFHIRGNVRKQEKFIAVSGAFANSQVTPN